MNEKPREPRPVGLKAIDEARTERGTRKHNRITGSVALVAGGAVVVTVIAAKLIASSSLTNRQEALLEKQRAAVSTVGAEWAPLRDQIEKHTLEAAREYKGDLVSPEAKTWDFRTAPGVYLRLRVEDAKSVEALRKNASESSLDSFAGCLLRENRPTVAAIMRGEDAGTSNAEDSPWNLRQGYAATRVLEDGWAAEVKAAGDELKVRALEMQYDKAQREEIPVAVNIVRRAQFFLLVLDEDVPEAKELVTNDAGTITQEALQQVPHPARVHIVNLKTGAELVRLRRSAEADFVFAGERAVHDPAVRAAMKRQVNNCALAQEVWAAIKSPAP